ncbi:MAG: aminotransferase class I/II-fold pyridoxal phosphate-dependent enzyme [Phycisphaerales bacterium]|nr:aminotransferase class I/II-fold pyridoxal phosphate-dependent enzyme [Phycisphaerales bacterium]
MDSTHIELGGRSLVQFASNDYLGLCFHPEVIQAAQEAMQAHGLGSGAAGLLGGYGPAHARAEAALARWKGTGSAVLFPSGYQANLAAVQTLASLGQLSNKNGVRFLVDKLVHASLIDAAKGTGMAMRIFPHNHLDKLKRLLAEAPAGQMQVVVTESIFSMDGDAADLRGLADLKQRHPFVLLLDEAHGSGAYGPGGSGYAAELGLQDIADVSVVTFSKALGCVGGAICGSELFCQGVINWGRPYIYSTSIPPAIAAAVEKGIEVIGRQPDLQARLRQRGRQLREALSGRWKIPGLEDCPIVPLILNDEQQALEAAGLLRDKGYFVSAVRPPTVPRGTSRLRMTVCAEHTETQVRNFVRQVNEVVR